VKTAGADPGFNFTDRKAEVILLAGTVIKLYEGMDDSLQFKTPGSVVKKEEKTIEMMKVKDKEREDKQGIRIKDFRGVACPMNFVKTKIELSTQKSGDLLEVWLDDGQPIQNVPGSVRNEGHEVITVEQVEDYWTVLIRKH